MNTKWKVILSVMLLIATICTVFISITIKQQDEKIAAIIAGKNESAVLLADTILTAMAEKYQKRAAAFSNPAFSKSREKMIRAFADRNRAQLLQLSKPLFQTLQKEDPYLSSIGWILPDNKVFLRVHDPESYGEDITGIRQDVVAVNSDKKMFSGFNAGLHSIQYRTVQPVFYHDKYLGAVQFGIKASVLFDTLHKKLNAVAGMAILNEECQHTSAAKMPKFTGNTHTIRARDVHIFENMENEPDWCQLGQKLTLDKKPHILIQVAPVTNFQGKKLGVFFVALDISHELAQKRSLLFSILLISFIILTVSFLILYFSYGSLIQKIIDLNQSLETNNLELEYRVQERTIKLQENKERLQKFLDHSPVGILIADAKTMEFQYANPAICNMLGYESEELSSMGLLSVHATKDQPRMIKEFGKLVEGAKDIATDIPFLCKDRTIFIADVLAAPLELKKRPAVIGFIVDRTEMKKLGKQLQRAQKMEAIGLMAGGVAHDLNNILAGIVGYPELMLMQLAQDSELREPLLAIKESGKRAATVVADLLTVARGVASAKAPHDIHGILEEYLNSPEYKELSKIHPKVHLTTQLDAATPIIFCSPVHIKKVIMNLVANAFEATENSENVSILTKYQYICSKNAPAPDMMPGDYVVLKIQDHGNGIAKKDLEHIFEPFYTRKVMGRSGTGLGLAVVWNTVHDHDGRIFIESNTKGTLFQVYFPVTQEKETDQNEITAETKNSTSNEHILVVDDEPQLRDIATRMLQTLGYRVDSVSSGEEAIDFIKENKVDLIVLDMQMDPGMNGRRTYENILSINPAQKAVIASGFSESDDVKAALKSGAGKFIKKPYSIETLGQGVKETLIGNNDKVG